MNISTKPVPNLPKRIIYGVLALIVSAIIAALISNDFVAPYPDAKTAYLICVAFAVSGLIQFIIGFVEKQRSNGKVT